MNIFQLILLFFPSYLILIRFEIEQVYVLEFRLSLTQPYKTNLFSEMSPTYT